MLPKTIIIGLEYLKPTDISNAVMIRELLEVTACYQIRRCLINSALDFLPVSYNYDVYKINTYNHALLDFRTTDLHYGELRTISSIIEKHVESTLEEFNLYIKNKPNKILNFNCSMMNRSNVLLTSEVIDRRNTC
jgi:hypothetical protein